jgi:hypothetical protein
LVAKDIAMRKLLIAVAAGVVGLALTGSAAQAREPAHHRGQEHGHRAYYMKHGHRFSGGYFYVGREHPRWSGQVWDSVHCRYQFFDPYLHCYYYWDAPHGCYYPVTYTCP